MLEGVREVPRESWDALAAGDSPFLDWDWLAGLEAVDSTEYVRLLRLDRPLTVKMSGRTSDGVILKPSK